MKKKTTQKRNLSNRELLQELNQLRSDMVKNVASWSYYEMERALTRARTIHKLLKP